MDLKQLHKSKTSNFKTPDNYFEGLEDRLLHVAKLKSHTTESGFKMPDNYLENFEIKTKEFQNPKTETKVVPLWNRKVLISTISIAASVLILMNLSIFQNNKVNFGDLDNSTLENYILTQEDNLQWETMVSDYDELSSTILQEVVNDEVLEDYLLNATDIEDFIQE